MIDVDAAVHYLDGDQSDCPECGSENVDSTDIQIEGSRVRMPWACGECGHQWDLLFMLTTMETKRDDKMVVVARTAAWLDGFEPGDFIASEGPMRDRGERLSVDMDIYRSAHMQLEPSREAEGYERWRAQNDALEGVSTAMNAVIEMTEKDL